MKALLPYVKVEASGIDGKPTIQFSGVNVQIVNGEGTTASTNGKGNLVIGYDEHANSESGSHDLILGEEAAFTSYGGIAAGQDNEVHAPFAVSIGGHRNVVSGEGSAIIGGCCSQESGLDSTISGGFENRIRMAEDASISGGGENAISGGVGSISGGDQNEASGAYASISGGSRNLAAGAYSWIGGGKSNETGETAGESSVSAGSHNKATGPLASVSAGEFNTASRSSRLGERRRTQHRVGSVFICVWRSRSDSQRAVRSGLLNGPARSRDAAQLLVVRRRKRNLRRAREDSNLRPLAPEASARSTELRAQEADSRGHRGETLRRSGDPCTRSLAELASLGVSTKPQPEQYRTRAEYRWARHLWVRSHGGTLIGTVAIAVLFGAWTGSVVLMLSLVVLALVGTAYARSRP